MSAVDELLVRFTEIGAIIRPAGDRLILRAGATPVPAELVNRLRQAKSQVLATLSQGLAERREQHDRAVGPAPIRYPGGHPVKPDAQFPYGAVQVI